MKELSSDIEAFVTHLGMNPVPQLCPVGHPALWQEVVVPRQSDSPVEGNPGHDLRMREMAPGAADLPDPVIRFFPDVLQVGQDGQ